MIGIDKQLNFFMSTTYRKPKGLRRSATLSAWEGLKTNDLQGLDEKIRMAFDWEHIPHEFQVEGIAAQLRQQDVLVHAGTGFGKTVLAAGPFAHERTKGMVSFMVSPLIALQEEQVSDIAVE